MNEYTGVSAYIHVFLLICTDDCIMQALARHPPVDVQGRSQPRVEMALDHVLGIGCAWGGGPGGHCKVGSTTDLPHFAYPR